MIARFLFHAFFLPAFEGPDEPFHLGRIVAFREGPFLAAFRGGPLPQEIASAVAAHPCAPDLHRVFGCPPFDGSGATFNVLTRPPVPPAARTVENYENQQPPLYYLVAGVVGRFAYGAVSRRPESELLLFRLVPVVLVALGFVTLFRTLSADWSGKAQAAMLLGLLLPGAAESLARSSNDAALFLWTATVVLALKKDVSPGVVAALLAVGPLIKLTAFPVLVMAVSWLWINGRRKMAAAAGLASMVVLAVELLRGWRGHGAYDLGRALFHLDFSWPMLGGVARSLYTAAKTVFWIGGWSFFRPPAPLVVAWFVLLGILISSIDIPGNRRAMAPHAAGILTALAGLVLLAIGNWKVFGDWGGLGGWYFWSWIPWLVTADASGFSSRAGRRMAGLAAAFVIVANVSYFTAALRIYG